MITLLHSAAVGTWLPAVDFEFTTRKLMSYSAVLGATEDVYLNDLRSGGIVGLPTIVVSPEWLIMNGAPYRALIGADDACMWRCIHVQQDTRVFQSIQPGQNVSTRGQVCVLRQTRIGAYIAVRLDTTLSGTEALVAQSWFCGIFLGDKIDGADLSIEEPPALAPDSVATEFSVTTDPMLIVTKALPHMYTEAVSIWNPIHTERSAARDAGLDDILLHGTCSWGAAGLKIIRTLAGGDPARLRRLGARMTGKALVGDQLFLCHKSQPVNAVGVQEIAFQVVNQKGNLIMSNGVAELAA